MTNRPLFEMALRGEEEAAIITLNSWASDLKADLATGVLLLRDIDSWVIDSWVAAIKPC